MFLLKQTIFRRKTKTVLMRYFIYQKIIRGYGNTYQRKRFWSDLSL
jgi:hypothetical protein